MPVPGQLLKLETGRNSLRKGEIARSFQNFYPIDIRQARFQILVPKNYRTEEAWGCLSGSALSGS